MCAVYFLILLRFFTVCYDSFVNKSDTQNIVLFYGPIQQLERISTFKATPENTNNEENKQEPSGKTEMKAPLEEGEDTDDELGMSMKIRTNVIRIRIYQKR